MSRSLIRKNQLHPDIADLVSGYGDNFFITPAELDSTIIAAQSAQGAVVISGNQTISGVKTFATGIVAPNLVYNTGDQTISGVKTFADSGIFFKGLDLQNSPIINSVPQLVTQTGNFSISGNSNGRMIISNVSTLITGTIMSGNVTGFNASIIQIGNGQIQITGVGAGIQISSYNNQYRTAGQFATISLLHTGNNGYIMYGNTSS